MFVGIQVPAQAVVFMFNFGTDCFSNLPAEAMIFCYPFGLNVFSCLPAFAWILSVLRSQVRTVP